MSTTVQCQPEAKLLKEKDPRLAALINYVGDYSLKLRTDLFPGLVRAIIGQQISFIAAGAIWNRVDALWEQTTPRAILATDDSVLKEAGLSRAKIVYIKDLAHRAQSKLLDIQGMPHLTDEDIMAQLTAVKGIGRWTAEIFLIFSLGRPDVFAPGDGGIKTAVKWLYEQEDLPGPQRLEDMAQAWKPYRTAAALYLWEIINRNLHKTYTRQEFMSHNQT